MDGETWYTWDCDTEDSDNGYPGCAGASPSLSHPNNCIDARDPELAGGDAFDLADIDCRKPDTFAFLTPERVVLVVLIWML